MAWQAVNFSDAAIERIKQAATFEKRLRLEAFLGISAKIGGIELRPITCGDLLQLEYAENRLVNGEPAQLDDYAHLIWLLRPEKKRRWWQKRQSEKAYLKKHLPKVESSEFIQAELDAFFASTFNDMPQVGGTEQVDKFPSSVWLCSLLDALCSEYGWEYEETLKLPASVAFQLMQRIAKRNLGNKYAIRNGITQRAKAAEMERLKQHG